MRPAAVLAALLLGAGCGAVGASGPTAWRAPGFQPLAVKRPAVVIAVSTDHAAAASRAPAREVESQPERYATELGEALNALGILPVDVALEAAAPPDPARALARARQLGAEHLLIVDARLKRGNVVHCRDARRPVAGPTVYWEAGLQVLRVGDGAYLLAEPAGVANRVVDVELDCATGRVERRRSMAEMIERAARLAVAPLAPR
jgi:hypothetical protein